MALPGGSLTPASDHPVRQCGWRRQSLWQPPRTSIPDGSRLGYDCPVISGTQDNETISDELPQESDGVTSCMRGCTILHKSDHAELVWGDLLG